MELSIRQFRKEDFAYYKSWFADKDLDIALGPMDDAWQSYIDKDTAGKEFAFTRNQYLVGVAGLVFPTLDYPFYVLTNIAVKPDLRGSGVGKQMIKLLIDTMVLLPSQHWQCYVSKTNRVAQSFFNNLGWTKLESKEEDMITYKLI